MSSSSLPSGALEAASLIEALTYKTRTFLNEGFNSSSSNVLFSSAPFAFPAFPLGALLPSQSTLLACVLALVLYVASWAILGARGILSEDEDERRHASFNALNSPKKPVYSGDEQTPGWLRAINAVCSSVLYGWALCVFFAHSLVYRVLPCFTPQVYLRGFSCASMPDDWTVSTERFRRTGENASQNLLV
jgi:hypothetical protein